MTHYVYLHYFAPAQSTVTVPDNLIGDPATEEESDTPEDDTSPDQSDPGAEQADTSERGSDGTGTASDNSNSTITSGETHNPTATALELYKGKPDVNQRFEAVNMLPGDSETKYFCVKAYHDGDIELYFKADITEQTKNLGDVLHIKVTRMETGEVLCDAAFSEVNGREFAALLKANGEKETTTYYQIDVSLDTAVGNEYQAAKLLADFTWYVKDEGGLTPPDTGDNTNLMLWIGLAGSSFLLILLLLLGRRRKEGKRHG